MKVVVLESPFRTRCLYLQGRQVWLTEADNLGYARACVFDCLQRGESAFAGHLHFTQMLDDSIPEQRLLGMQASSAIARMIPKRVIYTDRGISEGMGYGLQEAWSLGQEVEYRRLGHQWAILEIVSMSVSDLLTELNNMRS